MPRYSRGAVGAGLAVGAALGTIWVAKRARELARRGPSELIDWDRVTDLALRMNHEAPTPQAWRDAWGEYYTELVQRSVPVIENYADLKLPHPLEHIVVFTRRDWIKANVANFEELFAPVERLHLKTASPPTLATLLLGDVNQLLMSGQLGLLLGYLARHVLGQYDLSLLGREPLSPGRLYFVEPNIERIQRDLTLTGEDFRLWIALHETTHAFEFEAHPWLREHFNGLLEDYIGLLNEGLVHLRGGTDAINRIVARLRQSLAEGGAWIEMLMSPQQRELFQQLQAVMAVVEGYSNHIMNQVGQQLLPSYGAIKQRVEARQTRRGAAEKIFFEVTGLSLKMEQYRMGEAFVDRVVAEKGVEFVNRIWQGPEHLPSLAEVRQPALWIQRQA